MSTNKTLNYGLNQWVLSDKPVMDEFNEDNRKIDAALGSKVALNYETAYPTDAIKSFAELPNGYCRVGDFNNAMTGSPEPSFNGSVFTNREPFGDIVQQALRYDGDRQYFRYYNAALATWGHWVKLATTESPEKHLLPTVAGVTSAQEFYYYKNAFNEVTIVGGLNTQSVDGIANLMHLATLPTGFCPNSGFETIASYYGKEGFVVGHIRIGTDGKIIARTNSTAHSVYFNITFLAKNK